MIKRTKTKSRSGPIKQEKSKVIRMQENTGTRTSTVKGTMPNKLYSLVVRGEFKKMRKVVKGP